jgi:hypothetical protein
LYSAFTAWSIALSQPEREFRHFSKSLFLHVITSKRGKLMQESANRTVFYFLYGLPVNACLKQRQLDMQEVSKLSKQFNAKSENFKSHGGP